MARCVGERGHTRCLRMHYAGYIIARSGIFYGFEGKVIPLLFKEGTGLVKVFSIKKSFAPTILLPLLPPSTTSMAF